MSSGRQVSRQSFEAAKPIQAAGMSLSVIGLDALIETARELIGVRPRLGGTDLATGVDDIGFALVLANRLGLIPAKVLARYTRECESDMAGVRVCVELRRFVEELADGEPPQVGDIVMFFMVDSNGQLSGETPAIVSCLDPPTFIHLSKDGVIERTMHDCCPTRIFRLRRVEAPRQEQKQLIARTARTFTHLFSECKALGRTLTLLEWSCEGTEQKRILSSGG